MGEDQGDRKESVCKLTKTYGEGVLRGAATIKEVKGSDCIGYLALYLLRRWESEGKVCTIQCDSDPRNEFIFATDAQHQTKNCVLKIDSQTALTTTRKVHDTYCTRLAWWTSISSILKEFSSSLILCANAGVKRLHVAGSLRLS